MRKKINKVIIVGISLLLLLVIYSMKTSQLDSESAKIHWAVSYVTPNDPAVEAAAKEVLGISYNGFLSSDDVLKMQKWVSKTVTYKVEEPEYPNQTLLDRDGTCFTMCTLLYSMILNEDPNARSYMLLAEVWIGGEAVNHSAILSVFGSQVIISDPTISYSYINNICILAAPETAINQLVQNTEIEALIVKEAISFDLSRKFYNQQEFFDFTREVANI